MEQNGQLIGQLDVADFTSTAGLAKQGGNYFRVSDPNVQSAPAAGTAVEQGKLEASNTGTAESAVRLISIMRQFEMLQKAVAGQRHEQAGHRAGGQSGFDKEGESE